MSVLSSRLKALRTEAGMTQKRLSELSGVPLPSIRAYERGVRSPKDQSQQKIADVFNVSAPYLTGEADRPDGYDYLASVVGLDLNAITAEENKLVAEGVDKDDAFFQAFRLATTKKHLADKDIVGVASDRVSETEKEVMRVFSQKDEQSRIDPKERQQYGQVITILRDALRELEDLAHE